MRRRGLRMPWLAFWSVGKFGLRTLAGIAVLPKLAKLCWERCSARYAATEAAISLTRLDTKDLASPKSISVFGM